MHTSFKRDIRTGPKDEPEGHCGTGIMFSGEIPGFGKGMTGSEDEHPQWPGSSQLRDSFYIASSDVFKRATTRTFVLFAGIYFTLINDLQAANGF